MQSRSLSLREDIVSLKTTHRKSIKLRWGGLIPWEDGFKIESGVISLLRKLCTLDYLTQRMVDTKSLSILMTEVDRFLELMDIVIRLKSK